MKKQLLILATGLGLGALMLSGCNPQTVSGKTAELVYVNWAEGVAYTHLAEAVLTEKMGYDVKLTAADVAPGYTAVAQGSHDAFMECWRELHQDYLDRYSDDLVSLGTIYEGTETGLAVPAYVTIDKISELEENADKFGGHITGIDAGAGVMKKTEDELIPAYGLKSIKLMASSGPAMTAALADAVKNKEWIVVTAWKPHWMFGRWDMKFLEQDDDQVIWGKGNIELIGRADLEEDKPELAQFLKNMYLTDAELSDLMVKVNDSDEDVSTVAKKWMQENEEVISDWIPQS
ncbi:glycine betaine ABC transporter substrate-binding protein [Tichowtungia aerotolerans]|uniref:Glycine/betaine ABC transporter n=1 Tax=Tichowtungia aerotolerans TaxID=2697043 RepID=A0A6P1M4B2_9BACT|nr:glycine betaine ABC transporter substrate-binding protein [Tichowtungia aerotolerans]QHI68677.1 glycine/betaine ABC transporter [Tichowtungia aerotolerans]